LVKPALIGPDSIDHEKGKAMPQPQTRQRQRHATAKFDVITGERKKGL
jgi:hypothetical protein